MSPRAGADAGDVAPPTVIYIAGSGRSGSTLLERIIGSMASFVNVGELIDVFRRVAGQDELCGCGVPFSACPLWTAVGDRAFGGWSRQVVDDMLRLQLRVARQRYIPALAVPAAARRGFARDLAEYGQVYAAVYAAILGQSGADVVVDASKWAAQALAVGRSPAIDLRVVHLVRDVRGVAFSRAKTGLSRPHGGRSVTTMDNGTPLQTAVVWAADQLEIEIVRRVLPRTVALRYEDLVAQPVREISQALTALDLDLTAGQLAQLAEICHDGCVELSSSHGLSGNPSRFRNGRQPLRADEQWRAGMRRVDRMVAATVGAVPLARHGYLRSERTRPPGRAAAAAETTGATTT